MYLNAMTFQRLAAKLHQRGVPLIPRLLELTTYLLFNCSLPASARIGSGTRCGHRGIAVVVHPEAVIGRDCVLAAQVVVGGKGFGLPGAPQLGDRVFVGVGAKILGPVQVGDEAMIGANAVVLEDVPAGAVVAGNPARIIRSTAAERLGRTGT